MKMVAAHRFACFDHLTCLRGLSLFEARHSARPPYEMMYGTLAAIADDAFAIEIDPRLADHLGTGRYAALSSRFLSHGSEFPQMVD